MINFLKISFFFIISISFFSGCTSKIDEILNPSVVEDNSNKVLFTKPSQVELLDNTTSRTMKACSAKNQISLLVTEVKDDPLICTDKSKFSAKYKLGPICPSGVDLKAINVNTKEQKCSEFILCGEKPSQVIPITDKNSEVKLTQLVYDNLPWGCDAEIQFKINPKTASEASSVQGSQNQTVETTVEIKKLNFEVTPPPCESCKTSSKYTCAACEGDSIPPKIVDVFIDKNKCNETKLIVFAEDSESGLHTNAYSFDNGVTWGEDNFKILTGPTYNVAINSIQVKDRGNNISKHGTVISGTSTPCGCTTPWGEYMNHGATKVFYKAASVSCDQTCSSISITRSCNNGVINGSTDYAYGTCAVNPCPGCMTPWGEAVKHLDSVTAFDGGKIQCQEDCTYKQIKCTKGVWSEPFNNFNSKTCQYQMAACKCNFNGQVLNHRQSLKVYESAQVACMDSCKEGQVTCDAGNLSGQIGYKSITCSKKLCKCQTSWGGLLDLNQTTSAFKKNKIGCTEKIKCDDPTNKIQIMCQDYNTNMMTITQGTGNISDYTSPSCSEDQCGCKHLGIELLPNQKMYVYKANQIPSPGLCSSATNRAEVKCRADFTMEALSDTANALNTTIYKYDNCLDSTKNGTGTGNSDYNNGIGVGGGSGGGMGNTEGDGEGWKRRTRGGGGPGKGCDINQPPYICLNNANIKLVQLYTGQMCYLPSENGYLSLPLDPNDFTGFIPPGGYVTAYSRKEVDCADSCQNYAGIIKCVRGEMSEKDKFKYLNCTEKCGPK